MLEEYAELSIKPKAVSVVDPVMFCSVPFSFRGYTLFSYVVWVSGD